MKLTMILLSVLFAGNVLAANSLVDCSLTISGTHDAPGDEQVAGVVSLSSGEVGQVSLKNFTLLAYVNNDCDGNEACGKYILNTQTSDGTNDLKMAVKFTDAESGRSYSSNLVDSNYAVRVDCTIR